MHVCGIVADWVNEHLKVGASTALECMKKFCSTIIEVFGGEYLWKLNQADVDRLLQVAEAHDFPNTLRCIDYMHWDWKKCPARWKRAFQKGLYKVSTMILEAVTSYDTWIWHAFVWFGR